MFGKEKATSSVGETVVMRRRPAAKVSPEDFIEDSPEMLARRRTRIGDAMDSVVEPIYVNSSALRAQTDADYPLPREDSDLDDEELSLLSEQEEFLKLYTLSTQSGTRYNQMLQGLLNDVESNRFGEDGSYSYKFLQSIEKGDSEEASSMIDCATIACAASGSEQGAKLMSAKGKALGISIAKKQAEQLKDFCKKNGINPKDITVIFDNDLTMTPHHTFYGLDSEGNILPFIPSNKRKLNKSDGKTVFKGNMCSDPDMIVELKKYASKDSEGLDCALRTSISVAWQDYMKQYLGINVYCVTRQTVDGLHKFYDALGVDPDAVGRLEVLSARVAMSKLQYLRHHLRTLSKSLDNGVVILIDDTEKEAQECVEYVSEMRQLGELSGVDFFPIVVQPARLSAAIESGSVLHRIEEGIEFSIDNRRKVVQKPPVPSRAPLDELRNPPPLPPKLGHAPLPPRVPRSPDVSPPTTPLPSPSSPLPMHSNLPFWRKGSAQPDEFDVVDEIRKMKLAESRKHHKRTFGERLGGIFHHHNKDASADHFAERDAGRADGQKEALMTMREKIMQRAVKLLPYSQHSQPSSPQR